MSPSFLADFLSLTGALGLFVLTASAIFTAITLHEVSHGYVALRLGDPTAQRMGRLSLNPLRHVDPIGTVLVPILMYATTGLLFGWAKPVPIDPGYFQYPRRGMALVALAGPLSNAAMCLFWTLTLQLPVYLGLSTQSDLFFILGTVCIPAIQMNIMLMVLNLVPIPPLDGSRLLLPILPDRLLPAYAFLERFGLVLTAALIFSGAFNTLLLPIYRALIQLSLGGLLPTVS
ncbi:MAG: site-2 protease family protein [Pseudomonadota bacterium]